MPSDEITFEHGATGDAWQEERDRLAAARAGFEPRVVHGAAHVVELLEDALGRARKGELQGVIVCGITEAGCGWTGAYVEGIAYPWPRLQAAVDTAQQDLVTKGVTEWT